MDVEQPWWRKRPSPWLWLLALVLWIVWLLWPTGTPPAAVPYSVFVEQVRADNVAEVLITGAEIEGLFVEPLPWRPGAAPSAGAQTFHTLFPEVVGDPELLPLLAAHDVVVHVEAPRGSWLPLVLSMGLPFLLLFLLMVWMGRQAAASQAVTTSFGRTQARRLSEQRPEVTFADVAGAEEAKLDLQELVDFLRRPASYRQLGARIPRGVLLVGPPGTGKTLLARAVAGEAGVPFFSLSASEFVEMFVGVGASRVRDLFQQARAAAPAIVFIDELDAVGRRRGTGLGMVNDEREQTLNQLLGELDGFDARTEVIVLAATNRPDVLDPALLRPGRFDREVEVALPDRHGRLGILQIHTRALPLAPEVDLVLLASMTIGMSGASLANLCNEAALRAARASQSQVAPADFEQALDKLLLGRERSTLLTPEERRMVAYHEAGHALVAWLTVGADPVHKVTIIPHGRALGATAQRPAEERTSYRRTELLARLAVLLAGRGAEELVLGECTTGAEQDLRQATQLAQQMVMCWGMGSLGLMAFPADLEQPFLGYELTQGRPYSEVTAAHIDRDVQRLLMAQQAYVRDVLLRQRLLLDDLAALLLQRETVDEVSLCRLLGPRPSAQRELADQAQLVVS